MSKLIECNIYIIDDEPEVLIALSSVFGYSGFENVYTFTSWAESQKTMRTISPEIVLLDMIMPEINGEDAIVKIIQEFPDAVILMITGENDIDRVVRSVKKGATEYFTKPLDVPKLIETVKEYSYRFQPKIEATPNEKMVELCSWGRTLFSELHLPEKSQRALFEQIKQLVIEEKLYRKRDLKLSYIAEKTNSNTTYISNLINSCWRCSYTTWISKIRIFDFLSQVDNDENRHYSTDTLAFNSGFSSKSTFYYAIRSILNITPQEAISLYREISK